MSKCKGCGAEIEWISTLGGKSMPIDPLLIQVSKETHGKFTLVGLNGQVKVKASMGTHGYISHWATCKTAKDFKK